MWEIWNYIKNRGIPSNKNSMSGGLMSCVRENSPPLDLDMNASGPLSLPEPRINTSDLFDNGHSSSQHSIMSSTPLAAHSSAHLLDAGNVSSSSGAAGGGGSGCVSPAATPQATPPNTEQQKRRRFHPLRNLRRIFRRRTITTTNPTATDATTAPNSTSLPLAPTSSTSEKNLRSATLSCVASTSVASASSPSSPLTHQQLHDAYLTQSLPKSKSSYLSLLGGGGGKNKGSHDHCSGGVNPSETTSKSKSKHKNKAQKAQQQQLQQQAKDLELSTDENMYGTSQQTSTSYHHQHHAMAQTTSSGSVSATKSSLLTQRQSIGVAVFPGAMQRNFFAERQKLRSVGDSSQDLDSGSGNDSGTGGGGGHISLAAKNSSASGGEMSDSQRSLSEGRLIDSDYSRDGLSQSHDSVFSESATASSLSIVLKAELADVLRKRRNRPDASDEDLGLPRSPASPQRRVLAKTNGSTGGSGNGTTSLRIKQSHHHMEKQSEASSLSLLSMNSADGDDLLATSTANNSLSTEIRQEHSRYSRSSTMSSLSMSSDILRHRDSSLGEPKDEVDLFSSDWQRLSHSAAKHKMAIRPAKKKGGPSRQHRRTLETSIPEANEDLSKLNSKKLLDIKDLDAKAKTRSLPPGVNAAKLMEELGSSSVSVVKHNTAFKETQMGHKISSTSTTTSMAKTTKFTATTSSATTTPTTANATNSISAHANATTTPTMATEATSQTTSTSTTNNIFGFRSLTAKASSMFESKETTSSCNPEDLLCQAKKPEVFKKPETLSEKPDTMAMETQESGFLRRLMHRNSKRSIAKANAGDEEAEVVDSKQHEPKKMQMAMEAKTTYSSSSFLQDVTKSEFSYINAAGINSAAAPTATATATASNSTSKNFEQKHGDIKRGDFMSDSRPAFSVKASSCLTPKEDKKPEDLSPSKPKSGPAARQRYMPQNISNENLSSSAGTAEQQLLSSSKESILSKSSANEMFQSTSIIREITKQQNTSPLKAEHHFEKKPKIVGLSAFQQKISKSNESFGRVSSNTSLVSLEQQTTTKMESEELVEGELCAPVRAQIYDQKSRKAVEKSKSFRAYGEEKPSTPNTVHNNMPSLPDLSLNLRVPYYKEFVLQDNETYGGSGSTPSPPDEKQSSLGFEINDNKLMKPERKSFSNYDRNVILTTTPSGPAGSNKKLLSTPTISLVPPLSPSAASNRNISEIESNIDMIVSSPFISVIRKSSNFSEQQQLERSETTVVPERIRPTVLALKKEKSLSEDNVLNSPSTANVTLREKSLNKQNITFANSSGHMESLKDMERKSAPAPMGSRSSNGFRNNSTRRSTSAVEAVEDNKQSVPEFMKIQLNRVDPMRTSKSNVVLAKNVKETPQPTPMLLSTRESSPDDDFRRLSSESVDINERSSPEMEKRFPVVYHEAINKQAKHSLGLPPKSPIKKTGTMTGLAPQTLPATPTTPPTPTINEREYRPELELHFKLPETKVTVPSSAAVAAPEEHTNSLSLQERRRLFMAEDKAKVERKVEELKYERKRSINEEVTRKSVIKSESMEEKESPTENGVVLRKKSFASSASHLSMNGNSLNGNGQSSINNSSNNISVAANKTDATPELMKVFARRSLKIKDEDLDKILGNPLMGVPPTTTPANNSNILSSSSLGQNVKKFSSSNCTSTPSVDSDKENQSASEEKLDKLSKMETEQSISITKISAGQSQGSHVITSSNGHSSGVISVQRNSLADFRQMPIKANNAMGLALSNNNNNNNLSNSMGNNNNNNNTISPVNGNNGVLTNKSFLPPIKIPGYRHVSMERITQNNNNINNNNNNVQNNNNNNNCTPASSPNKSTTLERSSVKLADMKAATKTESSTTLMNKSIERSATVGEFKGIHQRRAEWEQRAKEALNFKF
ncbi:serine-rich adhesin for platelets isoform X1 [Stomoxys calcitrans]|uniref:serine-rich adhesin for platelets isoform X1 n=2 Tax=Stomoxys calcitrans TaxID=35570 RepID=UPI0027E2E5AB|nr:serine-rich adhesin for platelets isoform X1 [Stomoxys calcitrans]